MIHIKSSPFVLVLLLAASFLGATGASDSDSAGPAGSADSAAAPESVVIEHSLGTAEVAVPPETTVTFAYDVLDIMNALDIPVAALPKSHVPGYLSEYKGDGYVDGGTLFEPDFEGLFNIEPDVFFISPRQASMYAEFEAIAPTIFVAVSGDSYMDAVAANTETIAGLYGKGDEAAAILGDYAGRVEAVVEAAEGKTALIVLVNDGALSVYGIGSRFAVVHSDFGFEAADPAIEVSNHGQSASFEYIAEVDPDYLFVMDRGAAVTGEITAPTVLDTEIMRSTDVWKNGNVVYLDSIAWYLASGGLEATGTMIADIEAALGL